MTDDARDRPDRFLPGEVPGLPDVDNDRPDEASTTYSHFRTGLSRHRTGLSEHRTDLSEFRTDLSERRTAVSMRRTTMSIDRTRMSADRTLMSEIRTSMAMIGFGFTIYQSFEKLRQANVIEQVSAPRNFGVTLIALGILLLLGGIWRHIQFAIELRHRRSRMIGGGLIEGDSTYPVSITLVVAVLLMVLGLLAISSILFGVDLLG